MEQNLDLGTTGNYQGGVFSSNLLPFDLMFFLTSFFVVFVISFYWNSFETNQLKTISETYRKKDRLSYELIKQLFYFFPVLMIALIIQQIWPMEQMQLFPMNDLVRNSYFLAIAISTLLFIIINKMSNKSSKGSNRILRIVFTYFVVLYIAYVIVFLAALVIYINFHLHSFIWCFVLMLFLSSLAIIKLGLWWRILLLIVYSFAISALYSTTSVVIWG